MFKVHFYKGYELERTGTSAYPWNIYAERVSPYTKKKIRVHVGYERTMADAKKSIDEGLFDDINEDI